jgi:hypothetical protein
MRRILTICAIAFILATIVFSCTKETEPTDTGYKRCVVIEFFTHHDCQNCPIAEDALDSLYGLYGDSLLIIEYHIYYPGIDTLSPCTTFVSERETRYSVLYYPTIVFDGLESHAGASGDVYSVFFNILQDRFTRRSDLRIQSFNANLATQTSVSFDVEVVSQANLSGRLFLVLTEDSVVFSDSLYHFVARQVYPDEDGIQFSINEEDPFSTSGSIPLMWQPEGGDVWLNLFIQNMSNNTIYQGASVNLGKPQIPPSYQLDLAVTDTFLTVEPESTATFYLYLENTGSSMDGYDLVATQVDTVAGWSWIMCSSSLCFPQAPTVYFTQDTILPGEVDTFSIHVYTNTTIGTETIDVTFTSIGDPQEEESVTFTTEVP